MNGEHTSKEEHHLRKRMVPIALIICAVAVLVFAVERSMGETIDIVPVYVTDDKSLIALDGAFTVTGAGGTDPDELAARIAFEPDAEFSLLPGEEGDLLLQTYLPLEAGRAVSISLQSGSGKVVRRWQFQTEDSFRVVSVFPADGARDVPVTYAVEITLSYPDIDTDSLEEYISVDSDSGAEFHISRQHNTLFITAADRYYPAGSDIRVTVSGELPRQTGDTLGEDFAFSFTTGPEQSRETALSNDRRVTENIPPGEDVILLVGLGEEIADNDLVTTVYRYPDAGAYRDALRSYRNWLIGDTYGRGERHYADRGWQVDLEGLETVLECTGPAVTMDDTRSRYVLLPEGLEPGWYAAKVETQLPSGAAVSATKLLQVSPLSVYYAHGTDCDTQGNTTVLAWVNNTETGQPWSGADVHINAAGFQASGVTGEDGVALFSGPMELRDRNDYSEDGWERGPRSSGYVYGVLEVRAGEHVYYDIFGNDTYFHESDRPTGFMAYLFTDRPVYRPTDTVKAWGLLKPYREGTALPRGLHLSALDGTLEIPITLREDGTFQLEFQLESVADTYMSLYLLDEDKFKYCYDYLSIEDYIKPVYETASAPEKPVFTAWEDGGAAIQFTAAYFEGTPAQGYAADVRMPDPDYSWRPLFPQQSLTTDGAGAARVILSPGDWSEQSGYRNDWRPQPIDYGIYSTRELNRPQVQGGTFHYLMRDVALTMERRDGDAGITLRAHDIDAARIETEADLLNEENLLGAPTEVDFTAEVRRIYYKPVPDGERYDLVSKQQVSAYTYEYTDEVVETITGSTSGGSYVFTGLPAEAGAEYYLAVTANDKRGEPVREEFTYYRGRLDGYRNALHDFKFRARKDEAEADVAIVGYYGQQFGEGETLEMYLTDNGEEVSGMEGSMLYMVLQNDVLLYGVGTTDPFQVPFDEMLIPNYTVIGAYFDGSLIFASGYSEFGFDPAQRELEIAVEPGRKSYEPGDTAEISLRVTRRDTGAPAADTTVVAAVVDEAVFAIEEQTPDFLNRLYRTKSFNYFRQYTSYDNHDTGGGGMGGGGPDSFAPRVDFPDTAAFTTMTTDAQGAARLEVSLPDSLTSWRVTALALSPHLEAGDTRDNFTVSKDFFVVANLPPRVLDGDDVAFTLQAAGRGTDPDDTVTYTCTVEGVQGEWSARGRAGDFTVVSLPAESLGKAPAGGEYSVTVRGEKDGAHDALTLPLPVAASGIDVTVTRHMPLAEAATLHSTAWPVTLGFYDREHELTAAVQAYLAAHAGARTDQRAAATYLAEQRRASGMELSAPEIAALHDRLDDVTGDRRAGYLPFVFAQPDLRFTARMWLGIGDEAYSAWPLEDLDTQLRDWPDLRERAMLYLICSSAADDHTWIAQAVQGELESDSHTFADRMYLVVSLVRADLPQQAAQWYRQLAGHLNEATDANGNRLLTAMRDGRPDAGDTAAALAAAVSVGHGDANALARSLIDLPVADDLYLPELLYYLRSRPEQVGSGATVRYQTGGRQQTVGLRDGVAYRSFSREQLGAAAFEADGDVWVSAVFTAGLDEALDRDGEKLILTKTVEAADDGALRQGALARITLELSVPQDVILSPDAWLRVEDYVPTGMRYESVDGAGGWGLAVQNDQRVQFGAVRKEAGALTYYARCVAPGNYVLESAFAGTESGGVWGATPRTQVVILP